LRQQQSRNTVPRCCFQVMRVDKTLALLEYPGELVGLYTSTQVTQTPSPLLSPRCYRASHPEWRSNTAAHLDLGPRSSKDQRTPDFVRASGPGGASPIPQFPSLSTSPSIPFSNSRL
jgi:hypothetical protein